ncbi:hypothetical protein N9L27_04680 [Candidatus Poseidoniales archaeon]|jgi:hypothetical protein|nr:MAG: hypothetical protein MG2_1216 [uncultured Candidatus Poseidoniales archaeon]MBT5122197.1 hypothetical protein [Euryarchaeota archaeon]MDA8616104.1 hypothetical protein [Candidatus Poseidoniales archaeon]MBT5618275.1 hypothetical protein [Euryarchaeota archaeon]MBT5727756.1 hypothetical protein [Euryarchaeota archaeon]
MAEVDVNALLWALGLLSIPLFLALPMRIAWRLFTGTGHEESQYRNTVLQIIDAGRQVAPFRATLDDVARSLHIQPSQQRLIEADLFHPLTLSHFLLLPTIIIFPLAAVMALPVILLGLPMLILIEMLLIRRRLLVRGLTAIEKLMHWQIIHIPKPHRGTAQDATKMNEFSQHVTHFNHVPQGAFLGLFAWLIVHWTFNLDSWVIELSVATGLYIVLLGALSVMNTAFESDLVFVDPAKGRLVPVDQWLESILKPLVGIGLVFLIGRNLLDESRSGNAVLFATSILMLLYGAAVVGIAFRWGYSLWRGSRVKDDFESQIIEAINPLSYDLTRTKGRIDFHVRMEMKERLTTLNEAPPDQLTFADLQALPASDHKGTIPDNPL